ncbi:elongation factor G [Candidatus Bipolaricaulota bacterium]|nr:elongation factor G [Candidatus Bipolaricaulota bacterium]
MGKPYSVCLIGHSGSGKTALAEALLKAAKAPEAVFDRSPEEKNRGITIDLALGVYTWEGRKATMLVTPGLGEFVEEIYKGLDVADLTVLVVNAEKPVEVVTEQAWEIARNVYRRPALVFVNMVDKPLADPEKALEQIKSSLPGKFVPLCFPLREGGNLKGLADLLSGKDLPPAAQNLRASLIEEVASYDDAVLEKFLAEEEVGQEEVVNALRTGFLSGELVPILFGSATTGVGIPELLRWLSVLAPELPESPETKLRCFNLALDPYLGRLTYVRVLSGEIKEGDTLYELSTKNKVQLRDIYGFSGTKMEKVGKAEAGEIVALGKIEGIPLGATLSANPDAEPLPPIPFPKPVFIRAVAPKSQADEEKMSTVLRDLVSTKATLTYTRDPVTKEGLVSGMGDIHLDVLAERLRNRYGVEVTYRLPKVPYRETIRKTATASYRHKKQTGGRGQFGEVHLRIEPLPRGAGFEFVDETKGGVIPQEFIPGVEKGVRDAMEEGFLAGFPMVDIKAAVFYGMYHEVDSSELSFRIAARQAFKLAAEKADPVLLEPIMLLTVITPEAFTGDIISDLNGRRGRILGMESEGGRTKIRAEVPLAEILSYALDLKSMTQGRATFQMEFLRYDYVPGALQERVLAQLRAAANGG